MAIDIIARGMAANAIGGGGDVPTKLSQLTNDTGFITNSVDNLTNYYTQADIDNALDEKQNVLAPGTGIIIEEDVISSNIVGNYALSDFNLSFYSGTTEEFIAAIIASDMPINSCAIGEVMCSDLPSNINNAEVTVIRTSSTVIEVSMSSTNIAPYKWFINAWGEENSGWRTYANLVEADNVTFTDGDTFQEKFDNGDLTGPQGEPGTNGTNGTNGVDGADGLTTSITLNGTTIEQVDGNIDLGDLNTPTFYESIEGYNAETTQVLKHINGVMTWVTEE